MAIFNSKLLVYQRVARMLGTCLFFFGNSWICLEDVKGNLRQQSMKMVGILRYFSQKNMMFVSPRILGGREMCIV